MNSVFDYAKYFIKQNLDNPRNTMDGNMKLQKLLTFSYIYHYINKNQPLFADEKLYAYKNGCVCEQVRLEYKNNLKKMVDESNDYIPNFSEEEFETISFIEKNFGNKNAKELSELNHRFEFWKNNFENSKIFGIPTKSKSIVSNEDILKEKDKLIKMFEDIAELKIIVINGIKFYYNSNEIEINDEVMQELSSFVPIDDEDAYTVYFDEDAGIVIY